jgi:hypothetical protein
MLRDVRVAMKSLIDAVIDLVLRRGKQECEIRGFEAPVLRPDDKAGDRVNAAFTSS